VFDGAYSIDMIEHISKEYDDKFMENVCKVLEKNSIFIIGTPNKTAEKYASQNSKEGHINLKTHNE